MSEKVSARATMWHPRASARIPRTSGLRVLMGLLAVIAGLALLVIVLTWSPSVEREAGRTALSVLAVSVFGSLVALALDRYRRDRDRKEAERDEELRREADARIHAAEVARQEAERRRDDRRRQDIQLRSLLEETIRTYNSVKECRRLLKAYSTRSDGEAISLAVYDRRMLELIRYQLRFEEFKRAARVQPDMLGIARTAHGFRAMEHYLNDVIDEYLDNRHRLTSDDDFPLTQLPRLAAFLRSRASEPDGPDIGFNANMSKHLRRIVREVQGQLLRPSETAAGLLPVDAGEAREL